MNSKWFAGIPQDERDERRAIVMGDRQSLDILRDILQKELDSLDAQWDAKANYGSPAFAAQQGDFIGSRRTLKSVIALLNFDQKEAT